MNFTCTAAGRIPSRTCISTHSGLLPFRCCCVQGLATFTSLLDVLERCVMQYSSAVVSACGSVGSIIPRGDESFKLKQSGEEAEPNLLHRHAALLQKSNIKLQAVDNAARSAVQKAAVEMEERSRVDSDNSRSLASHSLNELCVHAASIQACIDMLADLATQIKLAWTQLVRQQKSIKQAAEEAVAAEAERTGAAAGSEEHKAAQQSMQLQPGGARSHSAVAALAASCSKLLQLSTGSTNHLFSSVTAQLYEDRKRVCDLLATAVVFVDWRRPLLLELYSPTVADGPRVVGGSLLDAVNTRMPLLYRHLQPALFPILCQSLLAHLCDGLTFVLLYGRRVVEPSDVQTVLLPDILAVELLYADELSPLTVEACCHRYRRLLALVAKSTEELLALYADFDNASKRNKQQLAVSRMELARVIGLRRGSLSANFMKKERKAQKQRQQHQTQHTDMLAPPLRTPASSSAPSAANLSSRPRSSSHPTAAAAAEATNPFDEDERPVSGSGHGSEDEYVHVDHSPSLPTSSSFPSSSGSQQFYGSGGAAASSSSSIGLSSLLSSNRVSALSASASLRNTSKKLSSGLSAGVSRTKLLVGQIKAKVK